MKNNGQIEEEKIRKKALATIDNDEYFMQTVKSQCRVGQIFDNYKDMCETLLEPVKSSNAKTAQLREWSRFMDFEKLKGTQKYCINKIYSKPKVKEAASNSVYIKLIELLFMYELSLHEGNTCQYSRTKLFRLLGMVNDNYLSQNRDSIIKEIRENRKKKKALAESRGIIKSDANGGSNEVSSNLPIVDDVEINHFIDKTTARLNDVLKSALKSMRNRCLIDFQEVIMISYNEEESVNDDVFFDSYKDAVEFDKVNVVSNLREATDDEVSYILQVQKEVLNEMGLTKIPFYNVKNFYNKVNERLMTEKGWNRAYKEYKVIFNTKYISQDIPIVEEEIKRLIEKNQLALNKNIIQMLRKQGKSIKEKNELEVLKNQVIRDEEKKRIEEAGIGLVRVQDNDEGYSTPKKYELGSDFEKNRDKLIEIFIKL